MKPCLLLLFVLISVPFVQAITYLRIDRNIVEIRLKNIPVDQSERLRILKAQFMNGGCPLEQITEQGVQGVDRPNLICTVPGTESGTIIFAARADFTSEGDEAKVDWATLEMLPLLAESLYSSRHRYTFVFIAFSGHKDFAGSSSYLSQLSESQRRSIRAMVDIEQIGRTPLKYILAEERSVRAVTHIGNTVVGNENPEDSALSTNLGLAAKTLQFEEAPGPFSEPLSSDATIFFRAKLPAITLTSPTHINVIRPSQVEVKLSRKSIDMKVYYDTYNLLCVYGLYLDRNLGEKAKSLGRANE